MRKEEDRECRKEEGRKTGRKERREGLFWLIFDYIVCLL